MNSYNSVKSNINSEFLPIELKNISWDKFNLFVSNLNYLSLISLGNVKSIYVSYSVIFKFPDIIYFYYDNKNTVNYFSKSKYGYYDFKVNENRIHNILFLLKFNNISH
jgi:hypothetical protein